MLTTCFVCGKTFETTDPSRLTCSKECRWERLATVQEKERVANAAKRKAQKFEKTLKDLKEYNETHGTHLSYGKFMALPGRSLVK